MPNSRVADSTIKGFLYQFNKTMLEILNSTNQKIHVEGIVEDIDIYDPSNSIKAIQCKYHEDVESFKLSLIYKPIILMIKNFLERKNDDLNFKLYIYIPSEEKRERYLTIEELGIILDTKDQKLVKILKEIDLIDFDKELFVSKVLISFGESIDDLECKVREELKNITVLASSDVDALLYPNFLNKIQKTSTFKNNNDRMITKKQIIDFLKQQSKAVISKWTLNTKSRSVLLKKVQVDLKSKLSANSLVRCFNFYGCQELDDIDSIAYFLRCFKEKYLNKQSHKPATFIFDLDEVDHISLIEKLYDLGVEVNDGVVGCKWKPEKFYEECYSRKLKGTVHKWSFHIRMQYFGNNEFLFDDKRYHQIHTFCFLDRNLSLPDETIYLKETKELDFIFGMRSTL